LLVFSTDSHLTYCARRKLVVVPNLQVW